MDARLLEFRPSLPCPCGQENLALPLVALGAGAGHHRAMDLVPSAGNRSTGEGKAAFCLGIAVVGVLAVAVVLVGGNRALPGSCPATALAPTLTALGGAASQSIWQLAVTNRSGATCLLEGFLAVDAQDERHRNIARGSPGRSEEERLLRLRPGMTAYSEISFAYYHLDTGEGCRPIASWLHVTVPDDKGSFDVDIGPPPGPDQGSTTFGVCGGFFIGPLQATRVG